jgi:hypothetical protein
MGLSGSALAGEPLLTTWRQILRFAEGVKGGVRDAGGVQLEFGVYPLQETGKRPTARASKSDRRRSGRRRDSHAVCAGKKSIARVREIAAGEAARVLQGEAPRYPVNRVEMGRERRARYGLSRSFQKTES